MTIAADHEPLPSWQRSPLVFAVLAVALVICWSSGFVGIRFANETVSVAGILFWRSFLSGLILLPFLLRGPKLGLPALGDQAIYAFLGMFLYLGGFALSISYRVPTGLVALMADLVPLAIAMLSAPILGQRLTGRQWLGTFIALAGVVAVSADALRIGSAPLVAYLMPAIGMIAFAVSTVIQKRRSMAKVPILQSLCLQCLFAAAMFAPFAASSGDLAPPMTQNFAIAMLWLVLLATFGAWSIYYLCLRLWSPVRVSAVIYLSPPVTMLWSYALFDEPLTLAMMLGLVVTLIGVWLVSMPKPGQTG
ncbi:DMT family transporter [Xinfangfangia sp. CPCC 101601]|uniref:DMT family transporter n=1 Tax=Pseudogemmobacter lacusdianii TaxID=3069608 RepID=A0ABU0VWZ6_9RHOB|nr:DMT family transporter [Xinfangfangia sp. CPCC 101601]MDQ2066267.1 DMT family transporter [Xinfangfangia sp. CPCC 101601]